MWTRRAARTAFILMLLGMVIGSPGFARAAGTSPGDDLFTSGVIPRLRIEIPAAGMDTLREYVWDKNFNGQDRTDVLATVREGNRVYTNVAVHLKGGLGSFRPVDDKPGLTLSFDKVAAGQTFHGLKKIYLNNSVQDPSYLSEKICREMFLAAGIPSPRTGHALVRLNERNLGLYVLVEGWNKQFLKQHFPETQGNLYDGGYGNEVTNRLEINTGDFPNDSSRLEALGHAAREPDLSRRLAEMGQVLDLDRFLTFMAMEVMLAHWDGYSMNKNNFRIFDDRTHNRLIFLPHGMDQMFGVFRSTPTTTITPQMKALVSRAVAEVPEGRRRYLERMSQLLTNVFNVPALTNRVLQLAAEVRPALAEDPGARMNFNFAVNHLITRMTQRAESVSKQLGKSMVPLAFDGTSRAALSGWRPQQDSGNPSFSSSEAKPAGSRFLEIRSNGGLAYGTWRTTVLLEAGDYQFIGKVQTQALAISQGVTRGGVTLRMSGERAS
jgi:spore coat protein CotH